MEDVFLTHLEMEFPEFRQIQASVKGELPADSIPFYEQCFLGGCLGVTACLFLKQIRGRPQERPLDLTSQ